MKLITHIVFSFSLLFLFLSMIFRSTAESELVYGPGVFVYSGILSVVINYVIDVFGHEEYHGHIRRSKVTHSLSTSSLLGASIGLTIAYFIKCDLVLGILSGLVVSLSHLFLDSITMGGIYICGKRYRMASYRYDNPILNSSFIIFSIFLLYLFYIT